MSHPQLNTEVQSSGEGHPADRDLGKARLQMEAEPNRWLSSPVKSMYSKERKGPKTKLG